jgi:tRNA (guanine-N7-)-methyltransferase
MTDDTPTHHPSGAPWRNFYGRFHGKTLRESQKLALDQDLDRWTQARISWEDNPNRDILDPRQIYGDRPFWLEIGFGGGEHLLHQAKTNPDVALLGCEPFMNGVAMFLTKATEADHGNARIYANDVRNLFDVLPDASVDKAFLLYPDPWPKKRHHRRRFVTPEHLDPLARAMKPGAEFRVATDIADYVRQTLEEVPKAGFEWLAETAHDWRTPWGDWISTRYEQKALREGRPPHYLTFKRL